ncbi:major facilitator transporter [Thecamonas trahens ATCC 50062]|uniref:Major facilitator transporter n=1 Tax=Thecamonas trahens ATCC 50062 TaxID=461836 RepID=A0A0L0DH03_THETB|nr:major facilitator transporter [Thecamonas trahens ATCC 50062]KNC51495.1 major facilitator transporter [Thecamonas trahens ATCC 50062]|eukprot:XP_013756153.1 major facilitator transporter [Thecamonas trahens ATCC 50062]
MASAVWGEESYKGKVMFIISFGCAKAATNLIVGPLADWYGRRVTLIAGMILGLPVPIVVLFAQSWSLVVVVNVLFGVSQGLIGSSLIFMMVDVFGLSAKGTAVGISECTIYSSVATVSIAAAALADAYGYRPIPFLIGALVGAIGLAASFLVTDTMDLVAAQQAAATGATLDAAHDAGFVEEVPLAEMGSIDPATSAETGLIPVSHANANANANASAIASSPTVTRAILGLATNRNFILVAVCGLVSKGQDAVIWGLAPEFLETRHGLSLAATGLIIGLYTGAWGLSQLAFGSLSDTYGRKLFLTGGMAANTVAILLFVATPDLTPWLPLRIILWSLSMVLLGIGTASIYPTMQAAAADEVEPAWRGSSLGIYRAIRDFGLAVGALSVSSVADAVGLEWSFVALAVVVGLVGASIAFGYVNRS